MNSEVFDTIARLEKESEELVSDARKECKAIVESFEQEKVERLRKQKQDIEVIEKKYNNQIDTLKRELTQEYKQKFSVLLNRIKQKNNDEQIDSIIDLFRLYLNK